MILGVVLLFLGILYLIHIFVPDLAIDMSIIIPGILMLTAIYTMIKNKRIGMYSALLLLAGLWWILVDINAITEEYEDAFWPLALIIIGMSIIINAIRFKKKASNAKISKDGILNYNGIFGGIEEKVKEKDFKGANIYSVFGGVDLDLREIDSKADIVINAYSVFGGSTLILPKNYNIILNSSAIFGANENKNENEFKKGQKTIYLNCISVFGGTDIK